MKKIILSLVVIAALSTACKKNYNCVCSGTSGGLSVSTNAIIDNTKSKATTACNAKATAGGPSYTCSIQ